jgi:hypothetical protein
MDTIGSVIHGHTQTGALLYLTGNPAQGKSVFAAQLIHHCRRSNLTSLHFFLRHETASQRTAAIVLRTIAFQLAMIHDTIAVEYISMKNQGVSAIDMSPFMLWEKLFKGISDLLTQPILWVLDGFDEGSREEKKDIASLMADISESEGNVRLIIIGRPEIEAQEMFENEAPTGLHILRVPHDRTTEDIRLAVTAAVEKRLTELSPTFKENVINILVAKSGTLFLWAHLALNIICRARREKRFAMLLTDCPWIQT